MDNDPQGSFPFDQDEDGSQPGDEFSAYHDMIQEGDIPEYGMRILVLIDKDGEPHTHFTWDGDAYALQLVGMLETTKFLVQMKDLAQGGLDGCNHDE